MSDLVIAEKSDLVDIADAVRSRTGGTDLLSLGGIAEEINNLSAIDEETIKALNDAIATKADADKVLYKDKQELTIEEINQVRENIHTVGQYATGLTYFPFTPIETTNDLVFEKELLDPVEAAQGAEIYNDYDNNIATGYYSIAQGFGTQALGNFAHASGWLTKAPGYCAIASGRRSEATGHYSHAEGMNTQAIGNHSHAENEGCIAKGGRSHAEGYYTEANTNQAHAEGMYTKANGINSHAEGWETVASGQNSFSGGKYTTASGTNSFANGLSTIAAGANQVVHGKYNIKDTSSLFIVGNGTSDTARSNAFRVSSGGSGYFAGTVEATAIILKSSTEGSTKYFKVTINDDGEFTISENV